MRTYETKLRVLLEDLLKVIRIENIPADIASRIKEAITPTSDQLSDSMTIKSFQSLMARIHELASGCGDSHAWCHCPCEEIAKLSSSPGRPTDKKVPTGPTEVELAYEDYRRTEWDRTSGKVMPSKVDFMTGWAAAILSNKMKPTSEFLAGWASARNLTSKLPVEPPAFPAPTGADVAFERRREIWLSKVETLTESAEKIGEYEDAPQDEISAYVALRETLLEDIMKLEQNLSVVQGNRDADQQNYVNYTAENERLKGAAHHMDACRSLLNVPDNDVLYSAIENMVKEMEELRGKNFELTSTNALLQGRVEVFERDEPKKRDEMKWANTIISEAHKALGHVGKVAEEVNFGEIVEPIKKLQKYLSLITTCHDTAHEQLTEAVNTNTRLLGQINELGLILTEIISKDPNAVTEEAKAKIKEVGGA